MIDLVTLNTTSSNSQIPGIDFSFSLNSSKQVLDKEEDLVVQLNLTLEALDNNKELIKLPVLDKLPLEDLGKPVQVVLDNLPLEDLGKPALVVLDNLPLEALDKQALVVLDKLPLEALGKPALEALDNLPLEDLGKPALEALDNQVLADLANLKITLTQLYSLAFPVKSILCIINLNDRHNWSYGTRSCVY